MNPLRDPSRIAREAKAWAAAGLVIGAMWAGVGLIYLGAQLLCLPFRVGEAIAKHNKRGASS